MAAPRAVLSNVSCSRNFDVSHSHPRSPPSFFTIFTIGPSQTFCQIAAICSTALANPQFSPSRQAVRTRGGWGEPSRNALLLCVYKHRHKHPLKPGGRAKGGTRCWGEAPASGSEGDGEGSELPVKYGKWSLLFVLGLWNLWVDWNWQAGSKHPPTIGLCGSEVYKSVCVPGAVGLEANGEGEEKRERVRKTLWC